ncbi:hypothetical protein FOCG_09447 [Fusarium oxysporum f. sp. radicis-lycopersici 26381]|nr:hypothetical protein FOWG_09602 [Fusarium oxysporum f. sp. lycopersici MN25]EXL51498.1 hypothetical protein FOCG_09447 [Fusarium oxysporum f. sp. radicis-lycopersici 26381]
MWGSLLFICFTHSSITNVYENGGLAICERRSYLSCVIMISFWSFLFRIKHLEFGNKTYETGKVMVTTHSAPGTTDPLVKTLDCILWVGLEGESRMFPCMT